MTETVVSNSRAARRIAQREQAARARLADQKLSTVEALLGDNMQLTTPQRDHVRKVYAQQPQEAERARLRALFGPA